MTLVRRRVVNPTPAILELVNPKNERGKSMATRKRRRRGTRRASARRNPVNPVNPTRRRRSTRRRGRRSTVYARRRNPINPTRRRRRLFGRSRRRRNPMIPGGEIFNYSIAGLAQGIFMPILNNAVGRLLPFGQYNGPALSAGTGWVLSMVFNLFGATRRFSRPALILGLSTAVIQIASPIVGRVMAGTGLGRRYGNGMRGIAAVHGVPPHLLPPPPPQNGGMRGIAASATGWGR